MVTQNGVKVYPMSLNGDTFNAYKTDFDQMLRTLLTEMEEHESEEATITSKITVKLTPDHARDYQANGYDAQRDIIKPSFKHDISTVLQVKNKKSGNLDGNMELVWDKETHQYIMRPIDNGQVSFFNGYDNEEQAEEEETQEANLTAAEPLQLPAPAQEEGTTIQGHLNEMDLMNMDLETLRQMAADMGLTEDGCETVEDYAIMISSVVVEAPVDGEAVVGEPVQELDDDSIVTVDPIEEEEVAVGVPSDYDYENPED